MPILSIDAGTTGVTALVVSDKGAIVSRGYQEFEQYFDQPGWVEHDPEQIWQAVLGACRLALDASPEKPSTIGITNQRETAVFWDRTTLAAPRRAIVWQDRRTAEVLKPIVESGRASGVFLKTGLPLDPYFSSSKFLWVAQHQPEIWADVVSGKTLIGTVDSYLVSRLTAGERHITDATNASRTQLMNLNTIQWDDELLELFGIPRHALPEIVSSYGELAVTEPAAFLGLELPINSLIGDQQAALVGQLGFSAGDAKCTYGTGAFILANTGDEAVFSSNGLLTTISWLQPDGKVQYAVEGSVFVAGAAVQWLRDGIELIRTSGQSFDVAMSVPDSGGVTFVPALTGLGAPFWDAEARGSFFGITRGTKAAHLVRATLEAIAFQVRAIFDALSADSGSVIRQLRVDGGAAANDLLLQMQADCLNVEVRRNQILESTGFGAALLAGLGAKIWNSTDELSKLVKLDLIFEPGADSISDYEVWLSAVEATRNFAASKQKHLK